MPIYKHCRNEVCLNKLKVYWVSQISNVMRQNKGSGYRHLSSAMEEKQFWFQHVCRRAQYSFVVTQAPQCRLPRVNNFISAVDLTLGLRERDSAAEGQRSKTHPNNSHSIRHIPFLPPTPTNYFRKVLF